MCFISNLPHVSSDAIDNYIATKKSTNTTILSPNEYCSNNGRSCSSSQSNIYRFALNSAAHNKAWMVVTNFGDCSESNSCSSCVKSSSPFMSFSNDDDD